MLELLYEYMWATNLRANFFPQLQFAEPLWDIMVEIYANALAGRQMSVSDACLGMGLSTSTALRCLKYHEGLGLIARSDDPRDARRSFVELSEGAEAALTAYFEQITSRRLVP